MDREALEEGHTSQQVTQGRRGSASSTCLSSLAVLTGGSVLSGGQRWKLVEHPRPCTLTFTPRHTPGQHGNRISHP